MSAELSLRVPSRIEELPGVSEAVEALGQQDSWGPELSYAVVLAIEELATNVVRHGGGKAAEGEIRIDVRSTDGEVRVELRDDGLPFDPFAEAPRPDTDLALEDRNPGGLGVHFVRMLMDEMSYERVGDSNHVTMVKRRT